MPTKPHKPRKSTPQIPSQLDAPGPIWASGIRAATALLSDWPDAFVRQCIDLSGSRRANGSINMPELKVWFKKNWFELHESNERKRAADAAAWAQYREERGHR